MPDIHDSIFPPTICNAWEDCNHDGVCHDPQTCGAIGPNAGEPGTQDDQTGNSGKSYSEKGQHVSGHAERIVTAQPTAYRVVSEPSRSWHFARTRDDAEKIACNLLKYATRCTDARIEPLYTSPSSDIPSEREAPQAIDPIISWMVTHGWLDADAEYSTADLLRALDDNYTEVGDEPQAQAVKALEWRHYPDAFPPMWCASAPIGSYSIEETAGSDSPSYDVVNPSMVTIANFDGLPEAKAAAQADFERRILSALTRPSTTEAQPVEALSK